jgi:hypothetical protein
MRECRGRLLGGFLLYFTASYSGRADSRSTRKDRWLSAGRVCHSMDPVSRIDAMTLLLERIDTEGLAQLSYLVGDSKAGVAAVTTTRMSACICASPASTTYELPTSSRPTSTPISYPAPTS